MKAWWRLQRLRWARNRTGWELQFLWDDEQLQRVYRYRCDAVRMAEDGRRR